MPSERSRLARSGQVRLARPCDWLSIYTHHNWHNTCKTAIVRHPGRVGLQGPIRSSHAGYRQRAGRARTEAACTWQDRAGTSRAAIHALRGHHKQLEHGVQAVQGKAAVVGEHTHDVRLVRRQLRHLHVGARGAGGEACIRTQAPVGPGTYGPGTYGPDTYGPRHLWPRHLWPRHLWPRHLWAQAPMAQAPVGSDTEAGAQAHDHCGPHSGCAWMRPDCAWMRPGQRCAAPETARSSAAVSTELQRRARAK